MVLLRVLNNYDMAVNPLVNGIASKQLLSELADKEDGDILKYVENNYYSLENKFIKNSNQARMDVLEYRKFIDYLKGKSYEEVLELITNNSDNIQFGSYITFMKYLSSLQSHLLYGSTKITDWISTSRSMDSILRYYDKQHIHKVAVIKSTTGGLVDSDDIMTVDVSNFESINKKNRYFCNQLDINDERVLDALADICRISPSLMIGFMENMVNYTSINSRGFKYSTNSKEVCVLRYIPKKNVIAVLGALEVDLARKNMFNPKYLYKNSKEQELELKKLKMYLLEKIKEIGDRYLLYLFDQLYDKNININSLISYDQSKEYLEKNKEKILEIARTAPNGIIKRF